MSGLVGRTLALLDPRFLIGAPDAAVDSVKQKFQRRSEVEHAVLRCAKGLEEHERCLVDGLLQDRRRVLVVGCGAGREALALARRGRSVVGIDLAPRMIEAARRQCRPSGADVRFEVGDVTAPAAARSTSTDGRAGSQSDPLDGATGGFDAVWLPDGVYSLIPGRELRVATLRRCARLLAPGGLLAVAALYRRPTRLSRVAIQGCLARLARGLGLPVHCEPGDVMTREVSPRGDRTRLCYMHLFLTPAEVGAEIAEAGLVGALDRATAHWIARTD